MISFSQKGEFSKITKYLEKSKEMMHVGVLDKYGKIGVEALSAATPKDTGKTASSWNYAIFWKEGIAKLQFYNTNSSNNVPIAILIQYGHATRNGGFIQGIDFINPAIKPIFEKLADNVWKEVTKV